MYCIQYMYEYIISQQATTHSLIESLLQLDDLVFEANVDLLEAFRRARLDLRNATRKENHRHTHTHTERERREGVVRSGQLGEHMP